MRGWQQRLYVRPGRFATKTLPEANVYARDLFMLVESWRSLIPAMLV
jgi:hypothetical protein